ncbi:MAG: hypothetical protein ABI051_01350 [Vicinamibacterales bacterium]
MSDTLLPSRRVSQMRARRLSFPDYLRRAAVATLAVALVVAVPGCPVAGQSSSTTVDATLFRELAWRRLGPDFPVAAANSATTPSDTPARSVARVSVDNAFPYRVCGAEAGHIGLCLPSRGEAGPLTIRDWLPVPAGPGSVIAPDPADADVVYTGHVTRFDRKTGQQLSIGPPQDAGFRVLDVAPLVFSTDGRTLYLGANVVWRTGATAQSWTAISPDLTRATIAATSGPASSLTHAAIASLSISPVDPRTIWAGTGDGLVQRTSDAGATWADVTPGSTSSTALPMRVEASHFDAASAYVTIDAPADSATPRALRTRDNGLTWTPIAIGLPAGVVHVLREDLFRRGLLLAATDAGVFASFDDGGRWQSIGLNMPVTSVRDLVVKENDIVAATEDGFWLLEDITPLRQLTGDIAKAAAFLFRPAVAWRMRGSAVPRLIEETAGSAAPADGVAIHYLIGGTADGPVSVEIINTGTGDVLRRFSSDAAVPANRLNGAPGLHRVMWDLRRAPVATAGTMLPSDALMRGVKVLPGTYQVRLTSGGRVLRQAVSIRMDPRVRLVPADLTAQYELARSIADTATEALSVLSRTGSTDDRSRALSSSIAALGEVIVTLEQADVRPTSALQAAAAAAMARTDSALSAMR